MLGILNIHKPTGITSRRVVDRVQRAVRPAKAGHAGTLDPLACGVLVVCVGAATRLVEYVQRMPKQYRATFRLGCTSNTEDIEGCVEDLAEAPIPSESEVAAVLPDFIGNIQQRPPAFSAIKVDGRRSYELARRGQEVDLQPRTVVIYSLQLVEYAYPQLTLDIHCGSGTYVRSLGRDLAVKMGTGAVMAALERTSVGRFRREDACRLDQISRDAVPQLLQPAESALSGLPTLVLNTDEIAAISHGRTILAKSSTACDEVVAFDADGQLVAILVPRAGGLGPSRSFVSGN
tara:strand:+ start:1094 stop:1963 length:870 start_codon:yes stop_codon:yes gene_type:complete